MKGKFVYICILSHSLCVESTGVPSGPPSLLKLLEFMLPPPCKCAKELCTQWYAVGRKKYFWWSDSFALRVCTLTQHAASAWHCAQAWM